ncbi:hypothetical protein C8255_19080 [filamentous cyanobacterium CCP3]|nr:hypothetical protein C8255_19080 [filamentous cyanobacterium CCP3]
MNEKLVIAISESINRIHERLRDNKDSFLDPMTQSSIGIDRNGVSITLTGSTLEEYRRILDRLLQEKDIKEKFSEKSLENILREVISKLYSLGDIDQTQVFLKNEFEKMRSKCKAQIVYIPIDGIFVYEQEVGSIQVGNILIEKITEEKLQSIIQKTRDITLSLSNNFYSSEDLIWMAQENEESLKNIFLNLVCAKYSITAEPTRAVELARRETGRSLDILRFAIPLLYQRKDNVRIEIEGDAGSGGWRHLIISEDSRFFSKGFNSSRQTFDINRKRLDALEKVGIFKLSELFQKKDPTDLEKNLIVALGWFSQSQNQTNLNSELLYLTICLEVFFSPERGERISEFISEGIAFMLGDSFEKRKEIKKKSKDLYDLRSKVVHGRGKPISEKDVYELQGITLGVIIKLIDNEIKFQSTQELREWIKDKKLGL